MSTFVTKHFTIEELYASATAKARGIDNKPDVHQMINLVYLAVYVLEPLRKAMGEPIKIGSGFRSERNPLPILMGSPIALRKGSST